MAVVWVCVCVHDKRLSSVSQIKFYSVWFSFFSFFHSARWVVFINAVKFFILLYFSIRLSCISVATVFFFLVYFNTQREMRSSGLVYINLSTFIYSCILYSMVVMVRDAVK